MCLCQPKIHDDMNEIKDWVASSPPDFDLTKPFNVNGMHASCWMGGKEETSESHKVNLVNFKNRLGSRMVFKPRGVAVRVSFYDLIINLVRSQHILLHFGMIEFLISYS